MPRRVLTPADQADIVRWAGEGLSDPEIASKLGDKVSRYAIYLFRKRAGVPSSWVPPPNVLERGEHGRPQTYDLGCRCPACRTAKNDRQRQVMARLAERTAGGVRQGDPWEPWETELLLAEREPGSTEILARYLGRSYSAVVQRTTRQRAKNNRQVAEGGTLW